MNIYLGFYQCSYLFAFNDLEQIAFLVHVEDVDRHFILLTERDCG